MTHLWILKMEVMTGLFFGDRLLHHLQCCHVTVNRPKMQSEQHCKIDLCEKFHWPYCGNLTNSSEKCSLYEK